jgi:predicted nuclease of predicted toxin-antitoxin system
MKILLNMSLTPRWAQYLQPSGFEVLHWSQIGPPDAPDEAVGVTIISPLRHTTVELEVGALLTIDADRTRIRLLPLQLTDES